MKKTLLVAILFAFPLLAAGCSHEPPAPSVGPPAEQGAQPAPAPTQTPSAAPAPTNLPTLSPDESKKGQPATPPAAKQEAPAAEGKAAAPTEGPELTLPTLQPTPSSPAPSSAGDQKPTGK